MQTLENRQGEKVDVIPLILSTDVQGISNILLNGRLTRLNIKGIFSCIVVKEEITIVRLTLKRRGKIYTNQQSTE